MNIFHNFRVRIEVYDIISVVLCEGAEAETRGLYRWQSHVLIYLVLDLWLLLFILLGD